MGPVAAKYVMGIDPGGAHTGIVLRKSRTLIGHLLIERAKSKTGAREPVEQYALRVADQALALALEAPKLAVVTFKIERVVPPVWYRNGQRNPVNPANLIDVAIVAGAVAARVATEATAKQVRWVRPGGHGKTPDVPAGERLDRFMAAKYPAELLPARRGGKYTDGLRHCRSAWDVSLARPDFSGA